MVLKSLTTENLFTSHTYEVQRDIVTEWLKLRKETTADLHKPFDETLIHKPFSLITIYVLLKE